MTESREEAVNPIDKSAPEDVLPKWIRVLNRLIEEVQASA
jgi:hypothetical protein